MKCLVEVFGQSLWVKSLSEVSWLSLRISLQKSLRVKSVGEVSGQSLWVKSLGEVSKQSLWVKCLGEVSWRLIQRYTEGLTRILTQRYLF